MIYGIMACDQKGGIGKDNKLPWPESARDMKHFMTLTKGHIVLMGRKTWDSLPENARPLPNRRNVVITSDVDKYDHAKDLDAAKDFLEETQEDVFIMGGATIYKELEQYVDYWYLTVFEGDFQADTSFSPDLKNFEKVGEITVDDKGQKLSFKEYRKRK